MLHMFGHGRQKENIILVPYVHSFFVCAFIHVLHGRLYYVSILGDTFVDKQLVPVFSGCVGCLFIQHHTTFCHFPFLYYRLSLCRILFKYVVLGGDVLKGWTV